MHHRGWNSAIPSCLLTPMVPVDVAAMGSRWPSEKRRERTGKSEIVRRIHSGFHWAETSIGRVSEVRLTIGNREG